MDLATAVVNFLSGALGAGIVGAILKTWLDHKLSVERELFAEERELSRKKREASAAVAEILAQWSYSWYMGETTNEDRWRLQATYWKSVLWLDKSLVELMAPIFALRPGAPSSDDLIIEARRILLGLSEPDLTADQLINWTRAEEA